jgi:hypothetical protein
MESLLFHVNYNPLSLSPIELAVISFIDCLIIHPFSDGNGRSARILFQWVLAKQGLLTKPIFPLLPAIRAGRAPFLLAIYHWEYGGNPLPLFDFVTHAVQPTLEGLSRFTAS